MGVSIPDKLYFKIGEVAELTGVKPHVLRYWESEFKAINPSKSRSNQRLYRKQDIELILQLKDLLYNQGFTIAGARKHLSRKKKPVKSEIKSSPFSPEQNGDQLTLQFVSQLDLELLEEIKKDILQLKKSLDSFP